MALRRLYDNHDPDAKLVEEITDAVWQRLLDSIYPIPVWMAHHERGVSSLSEDLAAMDLPRLLELRWRHVWRDRLDPTAQLAERIALIDEWIAEAQRADAAIEAGARRGLSWGTDEPNHDPEMDRPSQPRRKGGGFEYRAGRVASR